MNQTYDERMQKLTQALEQLPESYRGPALFLVKHYDFFEEMCRAKPLTEEQRKSFMDDAEKKGDTLMILLLAMERRINGDISV